MVEYSDSEFKKKLKFLTDSHKAINSLSTWCLERHEHYKSIIAIWSNTIKKVNIKKRLLLFYLANHIIQYSKKKNYKFVDRWKIAIQKAIPYVRDEEILPKISRIIKIWKERHVYNHSYLADLTGLLSTKNQKLKLTDSVQSCQACFKKAEKVKLLQKKLKSLIGSMPTNCGLPSPDINQSLSSTSSMSLEDLNIDNINYDTVLNSDNIDSINDTDIDVPTTIINYIKSYITPEKSATDQELYDPASVCIPAMEIEDQQSLTIQVPDTPSPPPDETFTNYHNKSSIFCTSSYEDYVHTPMSSTHQFITSEVSINMAPQTNSSSIINENIITVSHVPQSARDVTVHNDGSTNDTPASNCGGTGIDQCALASKITDRDEIVSPEMITKTSVIDHRNLISSSHNSSPMVCDNQPFSNIIIQPSELDLLKKAVSELRNNLDNLETYEMDLSDEDQKHPVALLPPLPPSVTPPMTTSTPPPLPQPIKPPTPPPMTTSNYGGTGIDQCALASKITDRDEIVSPEMITKTSVIDHRNLISSSHNSSPMVCDNQPFSNIIIQPSELDLLMKAVSEIRNNSDNLETYVMDLSDEDQKHPVALLPPLPTSVPLPMTTSTPPPLPQPIKPPTPPPMTTTNYGGTGIDQCALASKITDRDEIVSPEMITKTSVIDHRNLISYSHNCSPTVCDNQPFSNIIIQPSELDLLMKAVSEIRNNSDNLETYVMDLSDEDQKHPVALLPPLPTSVPLPMITSTPLPLPLPIKPPSPPSMSTSTQLLLPPPMKPPTPLPMSTSMQQPLPPPLPPPMKPPPPPPPPPLPLPLPQPMKPPPPLSMPTSTPPPLPPPIKPPMQPPLPPPLPPPIKPPPSPSMPISKPPPLLPPIKPPPSPSMPTSKPPPLLPPIKPPTPPSMSTSTQLLLPPPMKPPTPLPISTSTQPPLPPPLPPPMKPPPPPPPPSPPSMKTSTPLLPPKKPQTQPPLPPPLPPPMKPPPPPPLPLLLPQPMKSPPPPSMLTSTPLPLPPSIKPPMQSPLPPPLPPSMKPSLLPSPPLNNFDNLETYEMDLSDNDQKPPVALLPPLTPSVPPAMPTSTRLTLPPPLKPPPPSPSMSTSTPPPLPLPLPQSMKPPPPPSMQTSTSLPLPPSMKPPTQSPLTPLLPSPPINNLDNLETYDMDLSDDDQKHPVALFPSLPPSVPPPMTTSTHLPLPPPMKPPMKPPPLSNLDNLETCDMDLSEGDQNHPVALHPPLPPSVPPPMTTSTPPPLLPSMKPPPHPSVPTSMPLPFILPFRFVQQSLPGVTYQLEQLSQPWRKDEPSLNKIQSNIEKTSHCFSKFVCNQPQIQYPIHVQGINVKEDFTPKWMGRRISNWPSRDPRICNRNSRPAGTLNQGSYIEPEESAFKIQSKGDLKPKGKEGNINWSSRDPRNVNRHSTPAGTLNQGPRIGSEESNFNSRKTEEPAPTPLNRK